MKKLASLTTYTALTEFYSLKLQKRFKTGDSFKAPASIGSELIRAKVAIKTTTHKQSEP